MDGRILLYMNLLAASVVDLAVAIAIARSGPERNVVAFSAVVALLPAPLVPAIMLHRRLAAAM